MIDCKECEKIMADEFSEFIKNIEWKAEHENSLPADLIYFSMNNDKTIISFKESTTNDSYKVSKGYVRDQILELYKRLFYRIRDADKYNEISIIKLGSNTTLTFKIILQTDSASISEMFLITVNDIFGDIITEIDANIRYASTEYIGYQFYNNALINLTSVRFLVLFEKDQLRVNWSHDKMPLKITSVLCTADADLLLSKYSWYNDDIDVDIDELTERVTALKKSKINVEKRIETLKQELSNLEGLNESLTNIIDDYPDEIKLKSELNLEE